MASIELISVDGAITPPEEARIPVADDGLYRGDGVFEVVRLYAGRPFALEAHLDRLERSAARIELPVERARLSAEIGALLERLGAADAQVRIVLTRGGRRIAATEPLVDWGEAVTLASVTYSPSVILSGVKSISYAANMQATRLAKARGAQEALLVRPDGVVLEPPTSAIFWAVGGTLKTPSLEAGILDSITRRAIVEALEVSAGEFQLTELLEAGEAFLASTTREIQPVSAIDRVELGRGPATEEARRAFAAAIATELGEEARERVAP
jgi:branched-chain amino acid aminotransferase